MVEETWEIMDLLGIDQRRLRLKWISASEGAVFAEEIRAYVQELSELGDNPFNKNMEPPADARRLEDGR